MSVPSRPDGDRLLERRLARERRARIEAETIAESATRDLYDTVQELTRSTRLAQLLGDVAVQANGAESVEAAMAAVLRAVCDYTGWPVGHALVRSTAGPDRLVSLGVWQLPDDDEQCADFRRRAGEWEFPLGVGLPGRVLQDGEPRWIPALASDPNFPRGPIALDCGLRAGFALPVLIRSDVAGVLEFFSRDVQEPDDTVLRVAGFVGAQLGRVLERQHADERLRRLALYDDLTGLPNRVLLMERLQGSLAHAGRTGASVDVLYLDVDDFKLINDSQGHTAGDAVLAALATRLQEAVRATDTVAMAAPFTVARLGGDEFAVVLEGCDDVEVVVARIEARLRTPLSVEGREVFVSASIGTAPAARDDRSGSGEELLARANVAMHEAKRTGKGRHQVFEPRLQESARRRHTLGEELHRAVSQREFALAYQPVVDLGSGAVVGAEALVRWQHPVHGQVGPLDFIERAEETGLIVPIGSWVLREACRQAAHWRRQHPDVTVAVNVSGRQLREATFPSLVLRALDDAGLPPDGLCLEMTESMLMEHDDVAIGLLAELRDHGVHLAIDDFGTGYSSLGALRRLPADQLKIDRSFVSSLPDDDDAGTIAWAVVRLGHTLGMTVLAEGVETPEQRDLLASIGCDLAQGFLFSRPVPAADVRLG